VPTAWFLLINRSASALGRQPPIRFCEGPEIACLSAVTKSRHTLPMTLFEQDRPELAGEPRIPMTDSRKWVGLTWAWCRMCW
jgi:hypothetical protein